MEVRQLVWQDGDWNEQDPASTDIEPQLGFTFGNVNHFKDAGVIEELTEQFPDLLLAGCSTAGEIANNEILDDSLVFTLIAFEKTQVEGEYILFSDVENIFEAGKKAARKLDQENLAHVLVLSEGIGVNGSELVRGITDVLPDHVQLTGGLAGDGDNFETTHVFFGEKSTRNKIVVIGLYGDAVNIGHGCFGGWDSFGPDRLITKAENNILYELDDKPALKLYKEYLGDYAQNLPSSGLLFPLSITDEEQDKGLVRTILGVDEENQALIFAGDIPEGSYARLMKANHHRLIDGAHNAAVESVESAGKSNPDLAFILSCVGRRLVLKQRTEEELEAMREVYGTDTIFTGFYSYGEIAPVDDVSVASLHNQTMCITTISEE
ncbi:FIST signal transduction protein [Fodinibius halophilus]|uniref:Histidine kinase n=1 Tax=Fodinibius halophilus TaxID=1736908 RepID=A0A6M1T322_9BACT|nr:FIST N-terminal domain-containing protein [Fodinibius halophilus]NGP87605.1 hypothetical protein [Fodinibius halophilus]